MKIDLVPGAIPYKSRVRPLNPDQKEHLRNQIDEWLEQVVIEHSVSPWVLPLVPLKKKDGWMRWVTDLRELNKQYADDQGQLPPHEHTRDPTQSTRCYVYFIRCLWSLSCSENGTWEPMVHSIYQPLRHIPVYMNAVWISQCWECVQRDAGSGHEEGDRDFLTFYLDDRMKS